MINKLRTKKIIIKVNDKYDELEEILRERGLLPLNSETKNWKYLSYCTGNTYEGSCSNMITPIIQAQDFIDSLAPKLNIEYHQFGNIIILRILNQSEELRNIDRTGNKTISNKVMGFNVDFGIPNQNIFESQLFQLSPPFQEFLTYEFLYFEIH